MAKTQRIDIEVRTRGTKKAKKEFDAFSRSTEKVAKSAKKAAFGLHSMRVGTAGIRRRLGELRNVLLVVTFAFAGFVRAISKSIDAYKKQWEAEQQLIAGLRNVKGSTKSATDELIRYAAALQKVTTFGDENIISGMAMLATFQLNSAAIKQITPRMLDMAAAAKQAGASENDLKSIAIALGKGMTGQVGMLSRYGIVIDEVGLAAARAKGRSAEFNFLLGELDKNFKGIAKELSTSTIGQITQMEMKIGDLSEETGKAFVPMKLFWTEMKAGIAGGMVSILKFSDLIKTTAETNISRIEDERITFLALIRTLKDVEIHEIVRRNAIEALQLNYSEYIDNINLEKASNEDLEKAIRKVNEAYEDKLELAFFEIALEGMKEQRAILIKEQLELRKELEEVWKPKPFTTIGLIPSFPLEQVISSAQAQKLRDRISGITADIHGLTLEMFELKEEFLRSGGTIPDAIVNPFKNIVEVSEELKTKLKEIKVELHPLNNLMRDFGRSMAQAAIYGQNMGQAIVSALKAIAAEILAEIALYIIANALGIPVGQLSGGYLKGMADRKLSQPWSYGATSKVSTSPSAEPSTVNYITVIGDVTDEVALSLNASIERVVANA